MKAIIIFAKKYKFILLGIGAFILYKFYKKGSTVGTKILHEISGSSTITTVNTALRGAGVSPIRGEVVQSVVNDVYAAFYKDQLFGMGEDEEKAVSALNRLVSIEEGKAAATIYRANFNKSMYNDFMKYVSTLDANHKDIKQSILLSLRGI